MSWIYTVLFAGLMFSSQGTSVSTAVPSVRNPQTVVNSTQADETEKFEQTYPINGSGRVNVSNVNGSIVVEAWDRNEVKLQYTKVADSKERLANVEIKIESKPEYFSVETDYGSWTSGNNDRWRNGGKLNVEFHLMVPRGAVLNEIETVNGSVTVSNFVNSTKASAVNGSVNATNIRGTAKLSTVNGEVKADFDRLETGSKISLETVNGKVNLVIPSDANATLKADSLNGVITNDFGLPVRKGKYVGRDLYGRLGSGEIQIRLNSVNGGLAIGRKNDGKNMSPATNLLPQKQKDDEDWDSDDDKDTDMAFQSAKIDKEVAKAAKNAKLSTKASAKALADAKVEINSLQPELAQLTANSIRQASDAIEQSAQIIKSESLNRELKLAADIQTNVQTNLQTNLFPKLAEISFFSSAPRVEKKSESFTVKGTPKVNIDARGCSVTVRGWDKSEVQYRVVQISDQRSREPLDITENHSDSGVTINVKNPEASRGGSFNRDLNRVRIEVYVPKKSNLKISADGEIRLEGVSGELDLSGSDESVNVRDVDGILKVSSSDGRIRVIGFKGDLTAESSDGMISLEGDFRKLKARADEGEIFLTLPNGAQANIESSSDELRGDGIDITRVGGNEKVNKYKIGNGGPLFQLETSGEIHIRSSNSLTAGL